jgi:O-antigen ligase
MWLFSKQTWQLRRILIAAVGLLILAIPLIFFVFDSSFVAETMMASATDPSTLIWRIAGWRQLLMDRKATPVDYLIGQPAGTDQSRVIGTTVVDANPHNFYVQTFLCEGIAGILVLLWLYVARIRKFRKSPKRVFLQRTYFPERMWAMFLCAQMLFFLAYSPSYDQTLVLGMAVGIGSTQLCVRSRMRTRLRAPMPSAVEGLA